MALVTIRKTNADQMRALKAGIAAKIEAAGVDIAKVKAVKAAGKVKVAALKAKHDAKVAKAKAKAAK